ncbi:MAG: 2-C-methyl-D-erythritol 4-phosphate cytidylyltransferase [Odoribacteraceae bacterium]|jgi:2-C-methyl-D-erythritol 4-phosphate cytidylyltransferase|nr:2-C-methyl-D-erythritol 4-phosphate cytidylyltransferase [Odoribacteraceae bacterium]
MKQEDLHVEKTRTVAVILAGGSGQRAGAGVPKQYLEIAGRMVIERAVDAFERHAGVDEIVIVAREGELERTREIVGKNGWRKVTNVVTGGKERRDSCLAAIRLYDDPGTRLLMHDAARPLVSRRVIDAVLAALDVHEAVAVVVPVVDTVYRVRDGAVEEVPDRSSLVLAQTPQAFRLETIREAYARSLADPSPRVTDDCGMVRRYLPGTRVHVVPGEAANMKLTYPLDASLLERFLDEG